MIFAKSQKRTNPKIREILSRNPFGMFRFCSLLDPAECVHHPLRKNAALPTERERSRMSLLTLHGQRTAFHAIHTEPHFFHSFTGNDKLGASNVNYEDFRRPLLVAQRADQPRRSWELPGRVNVSRATQETQPCVAANNGCELTIRVPLIKTFANLCALTFNYFFFVFVWTQSNFFHVPTPNHHGFRVCLSVHSLPIWAVSYAHMASPIKWTRNGLACENS